MTTYRIAATNTSPARYGETEADTETAALDAARGRSTGAPGVSFGVFEVRPGEGAFLIAGFLNGERRFTAESASQPKRITICCYCRKRIYRQKDGTWYHERNGSTSCRPGEGSDRRATPLEIEVDR